MKAGESAVEADLLRAILLEGCQLIRDAIYRKLKSVTRTTPNLPEGWEHIEDALVAQAGKAGGGMRGDRYASAYTKVFRKKAPQARWIEWGHRIIGHKPNKTDKGKTVAARPFFRPGVDESRKPVRKLIITRIQALLQKGLGFGKPGDVSE